MKQLNMQKSMGQDQYPRTMTAAVDILANHKTTNKIKENNHKARGQSKGPKPAIKQSEKLTETSFAQRGKQTSQWPCNCCGEMGHKAIDCPKYATTLPNQWVTPPGSYGKKSSSGGKKGGGPKQPPSGMNGFQGVFSAIVESDNEPELTFTQKVSLLQEKEGGLLKDVIILDTGSTIPATFMNDAFLTDIQPSDRHMRMTTNAGTKVLKQKGHLHSFGQVWYDATQAVNLLGFAHLRDRFKTEYDYINDEFTVHFEVGGPIIFDHCYEGLYIYRPSDKFREWVASTKRETETEESQLQTFRQVSRMGCEHQERDRDGRVSAQECGRKAQK